MNEEYWVKKLLETTALINEDLPTITMLQLELLDWEALVKLREVTLVPNGGWEGKNEGQRKANEAQELELDLILIAFRKQARILKDAISMLSASAEMNKNTRRALEWIVRLETSNEDN